MTINVEPSKTEIVGNLAPQASEAPVRIAGVEASELRVAPAGITPECASLLISLKALGPQDLITRWQGHVGSELAAAHQANEVRAQLGWLFERLPALDEPLSDAVRPTPVNGEVTRRMIHRAVNEGYFMFVQKGRRKADLDARWWSVLWCTLCTQAGIVDNEGHPRTDGALLADLEDTLLSLIREVVKLQSQEMATQNSGGHEEISSEEGIVTASGVSSQADEGDLDEGELTSVRSLVLEEWWEMSDSPEERTLGDMLIYETFRIVCRPQSRMFFISALQDQMEHSGPHLARRSAAERRSRTQLARTAYFVPKARGKTTDGILYATRFADLLDRFGATASTAPNVSVETRWHTGTMLRYMAKYIREKSNRSELIVDEQIRSLLDQLRSVQ